MSSRGRRRSRINGGVKRGRSVERIVWINDNTICRIIQSLIENYVTSFINALGLFVKHDV